MAPKLVERRRRSERYFISLKYSLQREYSAHDTYHIVMFYPFCISKDSTTEQTCFVLG